MTKDELIKEIESTPVGNLRDFKSKETLLKIVNDVPEDSAAHEIIYEMFMKIKPVLVALSS